MSEKISLVDTIAALRAELGEAVRQGAEEDIQFPVGGITLEFKVAVTVDTTADAKVRFWVVEGGASGGYSRESVQTVTLALDPPLDRHGQPIKVSRRSSERP